MRNVRWGWIVLGSGVSIPISAAYLLAHAVKIAGGAVGGWLASRRRAGSAVPHAA